MMKTNQWIAISFRATIRPFILSLALYQVGCSTSLPESFFDEQHLPNIYPNYASITIPPNIAPLNFRVEEPGDAFRVRIAPDIGTPLILRGPDIDVPLQRWRKLLAENRGKELRIDVFVREKSQWRKFQTIVNHVAEEPIDSYVAYRVLEPGFELYREITLRQRNLETFEERCYYNNLRMLGEGGQCANCHAFQNYRTQNMLFHTRAYCDGTVFIRNNVPRKVDLSFKDQAISAATYPAWHPTLNLVVFSVNKTSQHFHTVSADRVEVLDIGSDLLFDDMDRNERAFIRLTVNEFETYPAWSLDGNWLYYCNAVVDFPNRDLDERRETALRHSKEIRYNLMRIPFDQNLRRFGNPQQLVDAASQKKNITFPRPSPDGRYVMYCLSDAGCFSIWHRETDLWILDLQTMETQPLTDANSSETESFHCWSSNGRWFVFSSRRDDGLYTRLYFSYFDKQGRASKPFLLPQRRPEQNRELMKSYNVPEFTIEPICVGIHAMTRVVQSEEKNSR